MEHARRVRLPVPPRLNAWPCCQRKTPHEQLDGVPYLVVVRWCLPCAGMSPERLVFLYALRDATVMAEFLLVVNFSPQLIIEMPGLNHRERDIGFHGG